MRYFERQFDPRPRVFATVALLAVLGSIGLTGCSHNSAMGPAGSSGLAPSQTAAINNLPPAVKSQAMQQAQFGQTESAAMLEQSRRQMAAEHKK